MSRPYKRICKTDRCGAEYTSKSNGRLYCYKCSPAQHVGVGRKDGIVSGTGAGGRDSRETKDDDNPTIPKGPLEEALVDLDKADAANRIGDGKVRHGKNAAGDKVIEERRPKDGWGKCKHINPGGDVATEGCVRERFSEPSPFCHTHLEYWREKRLEGKAKQMADEEVMRQKCNLTEKDFKLKKPQDAADLLAKINFAVYRGFLTIGKAKAFKEIIAAQISALNAKIMHQKIAILLALKKRQLAGGGDPPPVDNVDMLQDLETARDIDLDTLEKILKGETGASPDKPVDRQAKAV